MSLENIPPLGVVSTHEVNQRNQEKLQSKGVEAGNAGLIITSS